MSTERWAVILLEPSAAARHGWYVEGDEGTAEAFRAYVADEVDPAIKVRLADPVSDLLVWRANVALPGHARALAEIPLPPVEIARLTKELIDDPLPVVGTGVRLAMALDDWLAGRVR